MTDRQLPDSRRIGQDAEKQAADFLRRRGYKILETNVRFAIGELDIVAEDGPTLVFVEVRARRSSRFGTPADSLTSSKRRKVFHAVELYVQTRQLKEDRPMRIDVVVIDLQPTGAANRIELITDAFGES
ncbi:MAG TPA: YraN family protein [Chloroflexota bacterium]|nr:YraN family protein [Chloroflexota bacterium]